MKGFLCRDQKQYFNLLRDQIKKLKLKKKITARGYIKGHGPHM